MLTKKMFLKEKLSLTCALIVLLTLSGCAQKDQKTTSKRRVRRESILPTKGIKQVTLDEAILCKNYYKKNNNLDLASKYLERALALEKDHTLRGELMLEIADMYMELGYREKASKYYNQFKLLYPGSKNIKYVLYQEIVSSEAELLDSSRDQTKTQATLRLAQDFLKEYPNDAEYDKALKSIVQRIYMRLFKSELDRVRFYLNKYSYEPKESLLKAAHKRLQHLSEEYIAHLPDAQELIELEKQVVVTSLERYNETLGKVTAKLVKYLLKHEPRAHARFYAYEYKKS